MDNKLIQFINVSKNYLLGEREVKALEDVSLEIYEKEFVALIGSSGSGKTTALNLIGCLDIPTVGTVNISNQNTKAMDDEALSNFRAQKLGFVFQTFNLIPVLSAVENVEYPLIHSKIPNSEHQKKALDALDLVGLKSFADHRPNQLSGGQRQRVAIARALVSRPPLIIADEPTANLDRKTATGIVDLMRDLNSSYGITFVFSTHDPIIYERASRKIELTDGKVLKS